MPTQATPRRRDQLTGREREVVLAYLQHFDRSQAALTLGISERTLEWHVGNIIRKVGGENLPEAILRLGRWRPTSALWWGHALEDHADEDPERF